MKPVFLYRYLLKASALMLLMTTVAQAYEPRPHDTLPLSNNDIREIMIIESNELHPICPCPYSPDAMGGVCGDQSYYYRPGGFRIYCYMKDITPEEVKYYRLRKGTPYILEQF